MIKNQKIILLILSVFLFSLGVSSSVNAGARNFLSGTEWGAGKGQFVKFSSGGKVFGHDGCNRFFGKFTQKNQLLRFGVLGSTRMACRQSLMNAEANLLNRLRQARKYSANHLKLKLYSGNGRLIMVLRRRDWD